MTKGPYPNHLARFMQAAGLNDPDLAGTLGVSKQQIHNLRNGHRKLTVEWAKRLAPALGVSWQHLITGEPEATEERTRLDEVMTERGIENHQLAASAGVSRQQIFKLRTGYTRMSPEWAKKLAKLLDVQWPELIAGPPPDQESTPDLPPTPSPAAVSIPELDVRAMGGGGAMDQAMDGDGHHAIVGVWSLPVDFLRSITPSPAEVRIIRVVGDSMEPHYPAGDRVLVDTAHRIPSPPGVYVVWDGFGLVLKHVEVLAGRKPPVVRLSSDNPAYPPYECPVSELRIQGRVMGKWVWK